MLTKETPSTDLLLKEQVQRDISLEVFRAAKIPDILWLRKLISRLVRKPINRFSELIVEFDSMIKERGYPFAAYQILKKLAGEVDADGQAHIPSDGPLVLASNHPGAYDGLAIISQLPRNDFRLMVSGVPFFRNLPNASKNLIFVTHDTADRMDVLRQSIDHLKNGGSLLIFPGGRLDPDPAIFDDAKGGLRMWARSIEVFLKKVPDTRLVLTMASGVLSPKFANHPLAKLFKNDHEQRRFMEFMQVIDQMALGKPADLHPRVSFSKSYAAVDLASANAEVSDQIILKNAAELLDHHIRLYHPERKAN